MENSEVIKRICRFAGINETEEQLFFEAFTKKLFEKFRAGSLLRIDDIGFIHLKNIRTSEDGHLLKGIVFSETRRVAPDNNYFFLSNNSDFFHPGDFCFSSSLRKMEIPLGDEIDTELFIPPSGNELLSFIDVKVENLLSEAEVVDNIMNESEVFTIRKELSEIKEVESLEDISDFKSITGDKKETIVNPEKFQKIDSISSGFNEEVSNKPKDEVPIPKKPIIIVKDEKDEPKVPEEKGFTKVKFNRVESLSDQENKKIEEIEKEKIVEKKEEKIIDSKEEKIVGKKEEKPPIPEAEKNKIIESLKEEEIQKYFREKRRIVEESKNVKETRVKRKSKGRIFIPIIIVAVLAVSIYFYRFYDFGGSSNTADLMKLPASNPVEIERNYDIPVDYPYLANNKENLIFNGIDSAVYLPQIRKIEPAVQGTNNQGKIPTVKEGIYRNLGDYVFTDGKIYFVQVSSWKYESSALKHMEHLKKEGYNASVERVITDGGDIYYRVRIGDFNSFAQAKRYVQSN